MNQKLVDEWVESIPDFIFWSEAFKWIEKGKESVREVLSGDIAELEFLPIEWNEIQDEPKPLFNLYPSERWRKFVIATFLADLVSYPRMHDQVQFDRLAYLMHAYPQGFRTWHVKLKDGRWWPVGYTGWYPMQENAFELFYNNSEKIKNRMVVPCHIVDKENAYLYIFNFSVALPFKKSPLSMELLSKLEKDLERQQANGWACITVSEDGKRIAARLGLQCRGYYNCEGFVEGVYAARKHPNHSFRIAF